MVDELHKAMFGSHFFSRMRSTRSPLSIPPIVTTSSSVNSQKAEVASLEELRAELQQQKDSRKKAEASLLATKQLLEKAIDKHEDEKGYRERTQDANALLRHALDDERVAHTKLRNRPYSSESYNDCLEENRRLVAENPETKAETQRFHALLSPLNSAFDNEIQQNAQLKTENAKLETEKTSLRNSNFAQSKEIKQLDSKIHGLKKDVQAGTAAASKHKACLSALQKECDAYEMQARRVPALTTKNGKLQATVNSSRRTIANLKPLALVGHQIRIATG